MIVDCWSEDCWLDPDGPSKLNLHRPSDMITSLQWLCHLKQSPLAGATRRKRLVIYRRKLRLFACACCRHYWDLVQSDDSRAAVTIAERFADGLARKKELKAACVQAPLPDNSSGRGYSRSDMAMMAMHDAALDDPFAAAHRADEYLSGLAWPEYAASKEEITACWQRDQARICGILRDVVGNPFQPPPYLDHSWLDLNDGAVRQLANAIYDDRAFDRLPMLADALEHAGCADAAILPHCREPRVHVRGCWVIDALVGKS
jgi:hypothetical protein